MLLWLKILLSCPLLSVVRAAPQSYYGVYPPPPPCECSAPMVTSRRPHPYKSLIPIEEAVIYPTYYYKLQGQDGQHHVPYRENRYGYTRFPTPSGPSTPTVLGSYDIAIEAPIDPSSLNLKEPFVQGPSMDPRIVAADNASYYRKIFASITGYMQTPMWLAVKFQDSAQPKLLTGLSTSLDEMVRSDSTGASDRRSSPSKVQVKPSYSQGNCACAA